ncbi:hypothetical protein acdb102_46380 [Acidothermaceae bacterium B102]|nr:hypothetical protein acdb102_46380 [Acidothermaceae bacterium B102]
MTALLAGCASVPAARPSTPAPLLSATPSAAASLSPTAPPPQPSATSAPGWDVAWADLPGSHYEPTALPSPPLTTSAPACTAAQLAPAGLFHPGDTEDSGSIVRLRNVSSTPCLLSGPVRAVLHADGERPMNLSSHTPAWSDRTSFDMRPGEWTLVWFSASSGCGTSTKARSDYTSADIAIPGGGVVTVRGLQLTHYCGGPSVGAFYRIHPDPVYVPAPLAGATFTVEAPKTVTAGTSFDFVVAIGNPTTHAITMAPCPSYMDFLSPFVDKTFHELNCHGRTTLSAGQTLRFQMRLAVPAAETDGPEKLVWLPDSTYGSPPVIVTVVGSTATPSQPSPAAS